MSFQPLGSRHEPKLICQISFQDLPSLSYGHVLILEGPNPSLLEDFNDDEQFDEEDEFISPIQAWIDRTCDKEDFPWQGLMV